MSARAREAIGEQVAAQLEEAASWVPIAGCDCTAEGRCKHHRGLAAQFILIAAHHVRRAEEQRRYQDLGIDPPADIGGGLLRAPTEEDRTNE